MKMVRSVVAALAILAYATVSQGAVQVWYQTANGNGNGAGSATGAAGSQLNLSCVSGAVPTVCSWTIVMAMATNDAGGGGVFGWNTNLGTLSGSLSASNGAVVAPLPPGLAADPFTFAEGNGTGGTLNNLLTGARGGNSSGPQAGNFALLQFTLTKNVGANEQGVEGISARTDTSGAFTWSDGDGLTPSVQWGSNIATPADDGIQLVTPVIRITTTPEPASLALVVLGGLMAIRRRVSR